MKKIILYHSNPLKFGGVDTFDYNFCKKLKDKYDITFLYREGVKSTIDRLKDLGIDVQKYDSSKNIFATFVSVLVLGVVIQIQSLLKW